MAQTNDTLTTNTVGQSKNQFLTDAGGLDYSAVQKAVQANVQKISQPVGAQNLPNPATAGKDFTDPANQKQAQAAAADLQTQAQAAAIQAGQQGTALEMAGANQIAQSQRYDTIYGQISQYAQKASDYYADLVDYADQTVANANQRMGQVLDKLDFTMQDILKEFDTAKARAVEANAVDVANSFRDERAAIKAMYGSESPQYQRFVQSSQRAFRASLNEVQSTMTQMKAQIAAGLAQGRAQVGMGMSELVNYQEKGAVEARALQAQQEGLYNLQAAELQLRIGELQSQGMDNFLQMMQQLGPVTVETLPYYSLVADLKASEQASMPSTSVTLPGGLPQWNGLQRA